MVGQTAESVSPLFLSVCGLSLFGSMTRRQSRPSCLRPRHHSLCIWKPSIWAFQLFSTSFCSTKCLSLIGYTLGKSKTVKKETLTCKIVVFTATSRGESPSLFLENSEGCLAKINLKQSLWPYSEQKWQGVFPSRSFAFLSAPAKSKA